MPANPDVSALVQRSKLGHLPHATHAAHLREDADMADEAAKVYEAG